LGLAEQPPLVTPASVRARLPEAIEKVRARSCDPVFSQKGAGPTDHFARTASSRSPLVLWKLPGPSKLPAPRFAKPTDFLVECRPTILLARSHRRRLPYALGGETFGRRERGLGLLFAAASRTTTAYTQVCDASIGLSSERTVVFIRALQWPQTRAIRTSRSGSDEARIEVPTGPTASGAPFPEFGFSLHCGVAIDFAGRAERSPPETVRSCRPGVQFGLFSSGIWKLLRRGYPLV